MTKVHSDLILPLNFKLIGAKNWEGNFFLESIPLVSVVTTP